ncbi:hypothetical protein PAHAL_6G013300 [Panicum hallii]|uniref:Uncharacterized protein n=1 Tax=Panicum hallii TaxID=206008 RepID=A0A2S3HZQ5_9POAL|nr:hypothetical protein PAHAL_6G013300 [Panicum hallii]
MYCNISLISSNVDGNLPLPDWIGASAGWKTMPSLGASFGTPLPASATCLAASSSCIRISASGQNRNAIPRRRARIPSLGRWRRRSEQGTIPPSCPPSPSPAAAVQRSPTAAYEERF